MKKPTSGDHKQDIVLLCRSDKRQLQAITNAKGGGSISALNCEECLRVSCQDYPNCCRLLKPARLDCYFLNLTCDIKRKWAIALNIETGTNRDTRHKHYWI